MKLLIDFIPIVLFFIAFKFYGIYIATATAMLASVIQTLWHRFSTGKFEKMHIATLFIILILGGLTLTLQNELFIKWKPTIVNWAFALGLIISSIIMKKPAMKGLLGTKINLPDDVWTKLTNAWTAFFVFSGAINIFVLYSFSTEIWVNFKLFGMMGLTFLFIIGQTIFISKYLPKNNTDK